MSKSLGRKLMISAAAGALLTVAPMAATTHLGAAIAQEAEQTEDQRLSAFFEELFQRNVGESPIFQAQLGMKGDDYGAWDDFSDEEAIRQNDRTRDDLARLRSEFDYDALSDQMKVSYRIFEFNQEQALANFDWRFHNYSFSTMFNPATFPVTFLQNVHRVDTVEDAEAYISRLEGIERVMGQATDGIDMAVERGVLQNNFVFEPVLNDAQNVITGAPFDDSDEDSAILADFRSKVDELDASDEEKERLMTAGAAAMSGPFKAGLENFMAKAREVERRAKKDRGVWDLPNGKGFYENRIANYTSVQGLTADEVHQIGLDDVARIRGEMQAIMDQVGFEGSIADFFEFLRTDDSNFFPATEEGKQAYLDQSKAYIDEIYELTPQYFNILPKATLEVRAVEEWRQETAPIAFYNRPTPDGSRPGIYYTNLKDMTTKQKHEMETIAYHEGAPGHHFQIALTQELEGVPTFQKFAFFGSYVEGWALYSERLAKEMGLFTDPMQDFGRLHNEMLRAVRLVVDTGAHAKRWDRERMVAYMLDNIPMTEDEAVKEAERYIDLPGQALSYKIGMIKILDLREKAMTELGDKFDIRDFHDIVLKSGAVPLPVLEELVNAYIAEKNAA